MKQVLLRGGKAVVEDVPAPQPEFGQVLVRVAWSCVSPGTELASAAATSASSVVDKFRRNPALFRKAYKVLHERGFRNLRSVAQQRFIHSAQAGYSCAGTIIEVAPGVEGLLPGDRVACAGAGYANHAEAVVVPQNLVVKVPETVELVDASTVALGAIALQGVRRAQVTIGERVGVIGLGFVGQLTAQLLRAAGCKVFATDLDPLRVAQAKALGVDLAVDGADMAAVAQRFSGGYGLDAVLLTAATESDEPLQLAMHMARRKGRVVVVGDVGLGVRRKAMYAKELDLMISTSYGPGRYDESYEEDGVDYPYAYVRWTENRNMQAYLELLAADCVTLTSLTSKRLAVTDAPEAYRLLQEGVPRPYTVLLQYPGSVESRLNRHIVLASLGPYRAGIVRLALLGAGAFTRGVHLPNLQRLAEHFRIEAIVTRHGTSALTIGKQTGARIIGTDYREVLADSAIDAVFITTRHVMHATMVAAALRAGKHVFVEKPLALTVEEIYMLEKLVDELRASSTGCPAVFIGFNRRHSPYVRRIREVFADRLAPLHISYRMNAGYQPPAHWVHGPEGGGRILGEACHIVDLFRYLVGVPALEVRASGVRASQRDIAATDNFSAMLRYADGSVCTLLYTSQGSRELPKEAMEVHGEGRSLLIEDYRRLRGFGIRLEMHTKRQEKGHYEELLAFYQAIARPEERQGLWEEAVEVTRTTIDMDQDVRGR